MAGDRAGKPATELPNYRTTGCPVVRLFGKDSNLEACGPRESGAVSSSVVVGVVGDVRAAGVAVPSTPAIYRRAGAYIGKILGPTNPRDLPIEEPSRSELVVNLKTARALDLTLPESIVRRADRILQ